MRIEFYMIDAMLVHHYAPIIRALLALGADASFVSCRGRENVVGDWYEADRGEALIAKSGLPLAHKVNPKADMAVCIGSIELLRHYRKKRARLMYGCGVAGDSTHLYPDRYQSYDLVLVHGPFHRRIAASRIESRRVAVMGYPRYDDWFNGQYDAAAVRRDFQRGRSGKPILLYLPTWQNRSSLDRFAPAVFELAQDFDLLVKPHHCTQRQEPERMRLLRQGPVTLLDALMDPKEAYALADFVLGDITSGAYVEPLLLRKKGTGLGNEAEAASIFHPRVAGLIPACTDPANLREIVTRAYAQPWSDETDRLRGDLFDTSEGYDAYRAAEAMMRCVRELPIADPYRYDRMMIRNWEKDLRHGINLTKLAVQRCFPWPYGVLKKMRSFTR